MKLSDRSAVLATPSPLALAVEAARLRPGLIDLTLSNPTSAGLSHAAYGAHALLAPAAIEGGAPCLPEPYAPDPLGLESARSAVVRHWPGERPPDPAHVLLLPSSSEAYHYLFMLLCDHGDSVLAPEPSYPLLAHLARYAGVRLEPYRLAYDGAWHIDLDSVRRARTERTRAVILISPNNPTGSFTSRAELAALARLGLPLVSDEVFAQYAFDPGSLAQRSALHATEALTFCIDGLSKSAGLPQLKLSWLTASGPEPLVRDAFGRLAWLSDTYLSVATPVQRALPALLERAPAFRAPLLERLRANRARLCASLAGSAASVLHAEGGWYAVIRLPDVAPEEEWVTSLLERRNVSVHPGHFYDFEPGAPHLVVSLLAPEATLARGAEAIRQEVSARSAAR